MLPSVRSPMPSRPRHRDLPRTTRGVVGDRPGGFVRPGVGLRAMSPAQFPRLRGRAERTGPPLWPHRRDSQNGPDLLRHTETGFQKRPRQPFSDFLKSHLSPSPNLPPDGVDASHLPAQTPQFPRGGSPSSWKARSIFLSARFGSSVLKGLADRLAFLSLPRVIQANTEKPGSMS